MNYSLLGAQFCTDSVNIQQNGDSQFGHNRLAIIPRLNFTCNGRITSIRARVAFNSERSDFPYFQVWRPLSAVSTVYDKIGEAQIQSDDQVTISNFTEVTSVLTGDDRIEFQSGDVIGYYHPPESRYLVRDIRTMGYILHRYDGSPSNSVNLIERNSTNDFRQPLIQFTIGMK